MGTGSSKDVAAEAKPYLDAPADASDITTLEQGVEEVKKMR